MRISYGKLGVPLQRVVKRADGDHDVLAAEVSIEVLGENFTVADAYLFTVTRWADFVKLDLSAFPHLQAFQKRVAARPAADAALRAEGLIKHKAAA